MIDLTRPPETYPHSVRAARPSRIINAGRTAMARNRERYEIPGRGAIMISVRAGDQLGLRNCEGMQTATNYLHLAVVADMLDSATDDEIRIFDDDGGHALTNVIPTPLSGDSTGALYWPAVTGTPHADNQRTIAAFKIAVAAGTDINAGVLITITLPNVVDDYTLGKGFAVHWFLDDYVA